MTLELLHEFGLIDVDGDGRIEIRSLEILSPVKIGRNFLEVIQFHLVIRGVGIPQLHIRQRCAGERSFHAHHNLRRGRSGGLVGTGQHEHRRDVLHVLLARLFGLIIVLEVVIPIG